MVTNGWDMVVDYYKNVNVPNKWILDAPAAPETTHVGRFGSSTFQLSASDQVNQWHGIHIRPHGQADDSPIVHMVTEIPMYVTAKMEVQKAIHGNPIAQDSNSDGSPRYYTFGSGVPTIANGQCRSMPSHWFRVVD
jgi:3'-phosphoadenosine 5'-phosphosulfate synthase